jgi:hypothetical protein
MPFGPVCVLVPYLSASKDGRIHPKGTSFGRLRVEIRDRLDMEAKSCPLG